MAFSLNRSISHVSIDEPNLVELYRSTSSAVPTEELYQGHTCDAYICTSREEDRYLVFVAFFDTTTRRPIIFSSHCDLRKKADYKHLLNEALKLAASMGFIMEPVNLDYSTAMRQVIIRGIRVMRPPPPPRPARQPAAIETAPPEQPLPALPQPPDHGEKTPDTDDHRPNVPALPDTAPASGMQSGDVDAHRAELIELRDALALHSREKAAAEKAAEELNHKLTAAQRELSTMQGELAELRHERRSAQATTEERFSEEVSRSVMAERAASDRAQQMSDELAALRIEISTVQDTLKNTLKERQLVMNERDALRAELSVVKELAAASRQNEREALAQDREELKRGLQEREAALLELQTRFDTLCIEKEAELRTAQDELTTLAAKVELLANEKKGWHTTNANLKTKAQKALEQLKREKQLVEEKLKLSEEKAAAPPPEAIRTDLESGRFGAESPFAAPNASSFSSGFAGVGAASDGGTVFHQSPDLRVISYRSTDEIIELYASCNVVQTKLQGRKPQRCSAYICVLEQEGKTAVHLAWHLIETGEVVICLPEQQPEGTGNYAGTLQDALYYFEIAGFMMDRLEVAPGSQRQVQALEKIGICIMEGPAS